MRIIGGVLGGRRLRAPRGQATRPTADRVKESLFNILGPLDGARVLDLFAGSGALGLEALSRGAADAVFVDSGADAAQVIAENVRALGVAARARVLRGDVVATLRRLEAGRFDLVFLDPPYAAGLASRALEGLAPLLAPGGRVVVEHDRRAPPEIGPATLLLMDRRRYGDTEVSFYAMPVQRDSSSRVAVYPGSFDPITNGHLDILRRSLVIFDRVIVAIADNMRKQPLFTVGEREAFIRDALGDESRVEYDAFTGLLIGYCQRKGATTIVRGLRALADFEYEFQFAHMNRRLAPAIDTMFLMTAEENFYVSSSLVKEVASLGGDVTGLVPEAVRHALDKKYQPGASK